MKLGGSLMFARDPNGLSLEQDESSAHTHTLFH